MEINNTNKENKIVAQLSGRLDTTNAQLFETSIQPLIENANQEIEIDCTDLQYISSSGLRQFLALRKAVSAKGGKLVVSNVNNAIKDIFKMTGFSNLFEIK